MGRSFGYRGKGWGKGRTEVYELCNKNQILRALKSLLKDMSVESWYDLDYDEGVTVKMEVLAFNSM